MAPLRLPPSGSLIARSGATVGTKAKLSCWVGSRSTRMVVSLKSPSDGPLDRARSSNVAVRPPTSASSPETAWMSPPGLSGLASPSFGSDRRCGRSLPSISKTSPPTVENSCGVGSSIVRLPAGTRARRSGARRSASSPRRCRTGRTARPPAARPDRTAGSAGPHRPAAAGRRPAAAPAGSDRHRHARSAGTRSWGCGSCRRRRSGRRPACSGTARPRR